MNYFSIIGGLSIVIGAHPGWLKFELEFNPLTLQFSLKTGFGVTNGVKFGQAVLMEFSILIDWTSPFPF